MLVVTRCLLFLLPFIFSVGAAAEVVRPQLERVSFSHAASGSTLILRLHSSARIPAYSEPKRTSASEIEMVLFNTDVAEGLRHDAPQAPVRQLTLAPDGGHVRLRIDFGADGAVAATAYRDRDTPDLLIALEYRPTARPVADAAPSTRESGEASPVANENGNLVAGERWRLDTIVIDAGHGGRDPGAVANGVREKDVTLAVAKELGRLVTENLGIDVVYTRTDDRFIELRERGRIANEKGGKLFVSIHANSAPNRSAAGTETFILGPARTEAARWVMEKENQVVMLESDPGHYQRMNEEALIRQTLAQSAFIRKSEQLADEIEQHFSGSLGRTSRGVKQAGFYVLWNASMPAVLIELGFLTNLHEARFLASEEGQRYLARAIFDAVSAYKHEYERGLNLVRSD
jgi:N-acetylmuramoyl-L-alanine amidase